MQQSEETGGSADLVDSGLTNRRERKSPKLTTMTSLADVLPGLYQPDMRRIKSSADGFKRRQPPSGPFARPQAALSLPNLRAFVAEPSISNDAIKHNGALFPTKAVIQNDAHFERNAKPK